MHALGILSPLRLCNKPNPTANVAVEDVDDQLQASSARLFDEPVQEKTMAGQKASRMLRAYGLGLIRGALGLILLAWRP